MSDLINKEALRKRMYHEAFEKDSKLQRWDSGCWIRYKLFEDVLEDMPTWDRWIPVTERLPEIVGTYIITGKMKYSWEKKYIYFVDVADYDPEDLIWETINDWNEGQDEYEILAWQALPQAYKEEVDEL